MHAEARDFVAQMVRQHGPWERVVEVGSLDVNGSIRDLFGDCDYHGIDRRPGPGVDEVKDFLTWEGTADCLVCCEVLEHLADLFGFVCAVERVAPRDLIITCATAPRAPHGIDGAELGPREFYGNVHPAHLRGLLVAAGFNVRTQVVHEERGDLYLFASRRED